jgi:hemin uptake protein HemP
MGASRAIRGPAPVPAAGHGVRAVKRIPSEALLGAGREVVIVHGGREYRLRLTQNGKLILTA